jgi:hypothetical protein
VIVGAVLAAAVLGVTWWPASPTPPAPSPVAAAPEVPVVANAVQPTPIESAAAPVPSALAPPPKPSSASASSSGPVVDDGSEVMMLDQARAALGADPSRALALTIEHARRFPRGMLAQEREFIAINALVNMGRQSEARARAESFAAHFPGSVHRGRIADLVSGAKSNDGDHKNTPRASPMP